MHFTALEIIRVSFKPVNVIVIKGCKDFVYINNNVKQYILPSFIVKIKAFFFLNQPMKMSLVNYVKTYGTQSGSQT